jgi:hypothetical protein
MKWSDMGTPGLSFLPTPPFQHLPQKGSGLLGSGEDMGVQRWGCNSTYHTSLLERMLFLNLGMVRGMALSFPRCPLTFLYLCSLDTWGREVGHSIFPLVCLSTEENACLYSW